MKKNDGRPVATEPLALPPGQVPVVGIGASAGGLDAFKKLLKAIPENSGMVYVLVQHLDPTHESLLPELLQKVTSIPVLEISDDIKIAADHIYIIPSNKILVASEGKLGLSPRTASSGQKKSERHLPIDHFFTSLAQVYQSHAIGVVLSGTASDGTLGLKAIKEQGGITFAQDEASAAYEGMPQSAVQAGVVDFILPPGEIPQKLLEVSRIINSNRSNDSPISQTDENIFKQILSLLRIRKGTDFTYYKQTTIRRRILRRMALRKNGEPADYLKYLRENKQEQDTLYQDLLIPVTEFFRDKKSFDHLCESVFPEIIKNNRNAGPIRIWVAGCSTGEEAFSIAICLKEWLGDHNEKVQIFATDISEPAIAKARTGFYSKSEVQALSAQRRNDFFNKTNDGYQLKKEIRDMCVFAVHNFLKDPPFGKMDLVSCRNVLIYMEPYLQKKALTTFHYALKPNGFLLLGKSETGSCVPELFSVAVKTDKLFLRKDVAGKFQHVATQRSEQNLQEMNANLEKEAMTPDFQKAADDVILNKYMPAGVVVNEAFDIVNFRGRTADYLEQLVGKPSHNLLKLAKQGLAFELRNILHKAKKEKTSVIKENIMLGTADGQRVINIEALPLKTVEPHYLVLFHEVAHLKTSSSNKKTVANLKGDEKDLRIQQLEQELLRLHEDMRSITEDQEATNEELQSANEELLSSSEELQSLNEELETSKEELQSTNEELTVVNQELVSLNEQIAEARDYAEGIIATLHNPMLVLDKDLRIKNANKQFYEKFQVKEPETEGKLLYQLGNGQWNIPSLRKLLGEILPQRTIVRDYEVSHDFPGLGERIMLINARELVNNNRAEKSMLLSIADITEVRQKTLELEAKEKELLKREITERKIDNSNLQQAVQQRTKELQERNSDLKNINKELEAFSFVASHDLQEPLRKIQTFAQRILEKEQPNLSDTGKDYFNRMNDAANRMQTLIQDLMAFSRTSTGQRKFEVSNLNELVKEVIKEFKDVIDEKKATIQVGQLLDANVIPFQFRQLMYNLINNALKFSKPGVPPFINIISSIIKPGKGRNNDLQPNKEYCHIRVTDNGIGFEKRFSEKIFEVFQKLHGKEEYAGTGIGLAIVKKIVENHNGVIKATSRKKEGTSFDIYLPM